MNEYRVTLSNLRMSPRKVRLVADLIRNSDVDSAMYQLTYSTKRASDPMLKLLRSAIANARVKDASLKTDTLIIGEIRVDEGATLKRFRPVSRGRAHPIAKKTSHITMVVREMPAHSKQEELPQTEATNTAKQKNTPHVAVSKDVKKEKASPKK